MSEYGVVSKSGKEPATVESIAADLGRLGVRPGQVLLVHASLSSLGWVCGGPVAVIHALEKVLGPDGTLMMPVFTGEYSDPGQWCNPPVPESWWETIREKMPSFDSGLTPSREMGIVAETFRKRDGVLRSGHPQSSFAARGPAAKELVEGHGFDYGLGENSPLARLYDLDGAVLLLGVYFEKNTSLHLAEYRADFPGRTEDVDGAPVTVDGKRTWVELKDIRLDESDFEIIGEDFERTASACVRGKVGEADAFLMPQRLLVDFAVEWIGRNRRE